MMMELCELASSLPSADVLAARPRRLAIGLLTVAIFTFVCHSPGSFYRLNPRIRSPPGTTVFQNKSGSRRFNNGTVDREEKWKASGPLPLSVSSSWDRPDLALCQRDQIINGRWVPVHLDEPPYRPPAVQAVCYSRDKLYDETGWDTFKWVPSAANSNKTNVAAACEFSEWNREAFCEVARYGTILIVGDSLSYEHYSSLCQLTGLPMHEGFQHLSRVSNANVGHAVCDGRTRLVYRRDDSLTQLRDALLEIEPNLPQVLVLNRGAHYQRDKSFVAGIRSALDVVEEWLGRCDQLKIKCHFFWRTTAPGHMNCHNFTAPVNDKAAIEDYIGNLSLYGRHALKFHWYDFQRQNILAEEELKRRTSLRVRIIDGYHINVLRPDSHTDCLHSCYPGKMDVYSQLLLHYMRADRSNEDVERLEVVFNEHQWTVNVSTAYYDWRKAKRSGPATT